MHCISKDFVPDGLMESVQEALAERLEDIVVGYPTEREVDMGPVVSKKQMLDVRAGIDELAAHGSILIGGSHAINGQYAPAGKVYLVAPTVIVARDSNTPIFHEKEVFGPVTTLLAYDGSVDSAVDLIARGEGCLVSLIYSNDKKWLKDALLRAAVWNGRLFVVSKQSCGPALTPSTVLPNQNHGGPGRAGGGLELGGTRGLDLYTNLVAIQGDLSVVG